MFVKTLSLQKIHMLTFRHPGYLTTQEEGTICFLKGSLSSLNWDRNIVLWFILKS
jgi:hypothetical protein